MNTSVISMLFWSSILVFNKFALAMAKAFAVLHYVLVKSRNLQVLLTLFIPHKYSVSVPPPPLSFFATLYISWDKYTKGFEIKNCFKRLQFRVIIELIKIGNGWFWKDIKLHNAIFLSNCFMNNGACGKQATMQRGRKVNQIC